MSLKIVILIEEEINFYESFRIEPWLKRSDPLRDLTVVFSQEKIFSLTYSYLVLLLGCRELTLRRTNSSEEGSPQKSRRVYLVSFVGYPICTCI